MQLGSPRGICRQDEGCKPETGASQNGFPDATPPHQGLLNSIARRIGYMFEIEGLGVLSPHHVFPEEWWISQAVPVSFFSGVPLEFIVDVVPENGQFAIDVQDAANSFLRLTAVDRLAASELVFKNYRDFLEATDIDALPVSTSDDIWRFVKPTQICISRRHRRDRDIYVEVACECAWEEEHGLQLVYRKGNVLVRVSAQDGHLTEADAYNLSEDGYD